MTDEQPDVYYRQDDGKFFTTPREKDTNDACRQDDEEVLKAHGEGDADCARSNVSSWSAEEIGQRSPDLAAGRTATDDSHQYPDHEGIPIAAEEWKLDSIDEHPGSGLSNIPMLEHRSNLPGPSPHEKLPPSERYKPRPPLKIIPTRPSLTRASATYDKKPSDDFERKSSKRVSFQQALTPLYTPPSTTTSSPISSSASPQLPLRTIFAKPPPVSIAPGQYTPIASSSPISPSSPPATRKPYVCIEPTCDRSFDYSHDRDRHEHQHEIGNPPYSECPICHHSRSSGATIEVGLREMLIAHMKRRHQGCMRPYKENIQ